MPRYCSRAVPFQQTKLNNKDNVWCNPPFRRAASWLRHYLKQKVENPQLSGTFVLPYRPDAKWWYLTRGFRKVHTYHAGSHLFTMPAAKPGGQRRKYKECSFDVCVFRDDAHELAAPALAAESNAWSAPLQHGSNAKLAVTPVYNEPTVASVTEPLQHSELLLVNIRLRGRAVRALLDSGASTNFARLEWLQKHGLHKEITELPSDQTLSVRLAQSGSVVRCTH